jgi:hypothetical protein
MRAAKAQAKRVKREVALDFFSSEEVGQISRDQLRSEAKSSRLFARSGEISRINDWKMQVLHGSVRPTKRT